MQQFRIGVELHRLRADVHRDTDLFWTFVVCSSIFTPFMIHGK